jgi:hypothetical protein
MCAQFANKIVTVKAKKERKKRGFSWKKLFALFAVAVKKF